VSAATRSTAGWLSGTWPPKKLLPGVSWIVLFLIVPLSALFVMTFWRATLAGMVPDFTLKSYVTLIEQPVYLRLLVKSTRIALTVTALTIVIAYPFAYWTMNKSPREKAILTFLVLIPFWTSYLVRTYAWYPLLGNSGVMNIILLKLGIIAQPLDIFLFNEGTVHLALLYVYLPYAIIPISLSLDRLDRSLLDAAADLGAPPWRTFLRITLPLSLPGVLAGSIIVFILCLGAFVAPALLGGASGIMIANVIPDQFGRAMNWPLGGTLSILVMVTTIVWIWLIGSRVGLREIFVGK
jgi:spermidine/putrescine transport system permease protein